MGASKIEFGVMTKVLRNYEREGQFGNFTLMEDIFCMSFCGIVLWGNEDHTHFRVSYLLSPSPICHTHSLFFPLTFSILSSQTHFAQGHRADHHHLHYLPGMIHDEPPSTTIYVSSFSSLASLVLPRAQESSPSPCFPANSCPLDHGEPWDPQP